MSTDIKKSLKKDFFVQEAIVNLVAVPPLAYFVVVGFPALKANVKLFVALVLIASTLSFIVQVLFSRFSKKKILNVIDQGTDNCSGTELSDAKRRAFSFPAVSASAHPFRWIVSGGGVVFIPLYFKGLLNTTDMIFVLLFLLFSSILSMSFSFLRSEHAVSEFLRIPAIQAVNIEGDRYFKLSMTKKFIIINVFLILAPVGNILTAVYMSFVNNIPLETIQLGFWLLVGQGVILSVLCGRQLAANTKSSVMDVTSHLEEISSLKGDLRHRIPPVTSDEVGDLASGFNEFLESLQNLIIGIKASARALRNAVDDINKGSEDLASRTHEQAASITETSSVINEFTKIVQHTDQNSQDARHSLDEFKSEIQTNKRLISDVTDNMKRIDDSSKKINNIVDVINDISFQTNLLALNAAVEAARAGEAGRGFSVVAAEVRNLAQKTAESSATIQEIVHQNVDAASTGMKLILETAAFFETIVQKIEDMTGRITAIADSSKEQNTGIEQINTAISQLDLTVSQNAELVEDFTATIADLKEKDDSLNNSIRHFKTKES